MAEEGCTGLCEAVLGCTGPSNYQFSGRPETATSTSSTVLKKKDDIASIKFNLAYFTLISGNPKMLKL